MLPSIWEHFLTYQLTRHQAGKQQSIGFGVLLLAFLLAGCSVPQDVQQAKATDTVVYIQLASDTPVLPSETPLAKVTRLPPDKFNNELLRDGLSLQSYIQDECDYLALRWEPNNASPGTIVAPIMFHSIRPDGEELADPSFIHLGTFKRIVEYAKFLGFETITSEELIGFLYENKAIPPLSMLLILDDRKPGTAEDYFLPYLREYDWTATLAWLVGDSREWLWEWIENLNESGYFDIQSHGYQHIYLTEETNYEDTFEEISGNIPAFEERFGQRPIAYIWPGGNYTKIGIEIARELDYQIGFTVHSRGAIQFNSIPQGEQEIAFADPLMTLPRFWSSAALLNLDQALQSSQAAKDFAIQNYELEAEWYQANCGGVLAPLADIIASE